MVREMPFYELELEIGIMLRTLRVPTKKFSVAPKVAIQFLCEDFGVIVSAILESDYAFIHKTLSEKYQDYRYIYISTFDDLTEKKDELVWTLMKGGYMKYVRMNFPRQFQRIIHEGYGNKIIKERLRRWADRPKYRFFIEENKQAQNMPTTMILSTEPAFFDYMP